MMSLRLRNMTPADIPFGMRLKNIAGWNQTEADWRRFLELGPEGCFLAESEGRPIATTTTCLLGDIGWIAMVLVDPPDRHRGVGTRMVEHALAYLEAAGARSARLDATPLGQPVYERLGFVAEYELIRLEASAARVEPDREHAVPVRPEDRPALVQLDRRVTGTGRGRLIERLLDEFASTAALIPVDSAPRGYAVLRPGSRAWQAGPVIAQTPDVGIALLQWACRAAGGQPMFVDVPCDNRDAVQLLRDAGFQEQRRLTRMVRGAPVRDAPGKIWASSGPEKG